MTTSGGDRTEDERREDDRKNLRRIVTVIAVAWVVFACSRISLFVIPPIGVIPDGATLVLWKGEKMKFIDSMDAACKRERGGVTLICRGAVMTTLAENDDKRIATLPYSRTLYLWSTGGAEYTWN
jgi:hypothetical protein